MKRLRKVSENLLFWRDLKRKVSEGFIWRDSERKVSEGNFTSTIANNWKGVSFLRRCTSCIPIPPNKVATVFQYELMKSRNLSVFTWEYGLMGFTFNQVFMEQRNRWNHIWIFNISLKLSVFYCHSFFWFHLFPKCVRKGVQKKLFQFLNKKT